MIIKKESYVGLNYDKFEFYALSGDQKNFIPGTNVYTLEPGNGKKELMRNKDLMTLFRFEITV